ncbi:MAG TPA: phosphate acyltransferase PlsX [Edaphocola sp.]|nr:phosphate acyltransferase PlsX [Edaphocola sp.]
MNIGLDVMGGDYAPMEAIKGVLSYLQSENVAEGVHFVLTGIPELTLPLLPLLNAYKDAYTFLPCTEAIGMQEHPTKALKEKPDSSIAKGFGLLQQQKIDALIGAGNTGAMMVGAIYTVKAIPGVLRPTIASPIPKLDGKFNFLLDVGANADCKAEHLVQFAQMGSLYAQNVLNLDNPRVALLNLGEEEGKGNILAQATYPLLAEHGDINFIGNKEGRDLFLDEADVFICEGFAGNIVLKMAESIYHIFKYKRHIEDQFLEQFNYELYGGTPILGINAPVIIGHGISHASAFHSMINSAVKLVQSQLIPILQNHFKPD